MKAFKILLLLATSFAFSAMEYNALEEGVTEQLTAKEIAEIKPWAETSQVFLQELLTQTQNLSKQQKITQLEDGIQGVVLDSAPKRSELFLRYALNRGVYMSRILAQEAGGFPNVQIARIRILERSIHLALQFYQNDIRFLTEGEDPRLSRVEFALEWMELNQELARSIQDASAQYELYLFGLERLQVDLGKSVERERLAEEIIRIEKQLQLQKLLNPKNLSDQELLAQIRYLKLAVGGFGLSDTFDYLYSYRVDLKAKYSIDGNASIFPVIAKDGTVVVGSDDGSIYFLDLNGGLKAKYQLPGDDFVSSFPAITPDGTVVVGTWRGNIYFLDLNGYLKAKYRAGDSACSSPTIALDGTVVLGTLNGNIYFLDLNGNLKAKHQRSYGIVTSPLLRQMEQW